MADDVLYLLAKSHVLVGIEDEVQEVKTFCKWIWGSYRAKLGRTIFQILFLTLRESVYC